MPGQNRSNGVNPVIKASEEAVMSGKLAVHLRFEEVRTLCRRGHLISCSLQRGGNPRINNLI
ncbi:unnamed protein product [Gemmataceae bacterium]|nr:unnamed protein product [Gemmataceae bacterium]VTU02536.1 unnamed protein product [Gemmataceae bacterium]